MKKYCLLFMSLCLVLFSLVGCNKQEPGEIVVPETSESEISSLFKEEYYRENIEDYVFKDVYSTPKLVVYEIYNKNIEKQNQNFEYNSKTFEKEATAELDVFDLFLLRDNEVSSLMKDIENHRIGYAEISEFIEQYITKEETLSSEENEMNWVYEKEMKLRELKVIQEDSTNMPLEASVSLYNLGSWDYDWVVLYSREMSNELTDILFVKYDTEEQKENILKGIEYRLNEYCTEESTKSLCTYAKDNQRFYYHDNILIWVSLVNPDTDTFEKLDELFAN